ncbi:hypothetical protein [Mangrovicoccus sp. HB161399]|uniref:hypothetical protein n=1 Tax=Mangrovicoccus sp. HB161399 TaxID=2720392 RepID=UPI0015539BA5|nr:hypothetical protein [Mangrovicoccus sp. HB161399]
MLVFCIRDLGSSARDARLWRERLEALGADLEELFPPDPKARKGRGRPAKFVPRDEAQDCAMMRIWLDGGLTEEERRHRIHYIFGQPVPRHRLVWRYGSPSDPKPPRLWDK